MNNWYVSKIYNGQGLVIEEKTGENIAVTYKAENAPKIAALPDLLEVANQIVLARENHEGDIPDDIYRGALEAVQKARGE